MYLIEAYGTRVPVFDTVLKQYLHGPRYGSGGLLPPRPHPLRPLRVHIPRDGATSDRYGTPAGDQAARKDSPGRGLERWRSKCRQ